VVKLADGRVFVSPSNDLLFRWVFGSTDGLELLGWLLDAVLVLPDGDLDQVVLAATRLDSELPGGKGVVLDLTVRTKSGRFIDVEMQVLPTAGFADRLVFYAARMLNSQLGRSQGYEELSPAVLVAITRYAMFPEEPGYHHAFHLRDGDNRVVLSEVLEVHTVELPKVPVVNDGSRLWAWSRFMAARTEEELDMAAAANPRVAQAVQRVRYFTADEQRRLDLESRDKWLRDQITRENTARKEGRAEGQAEGRAEGRTEGRAEGIAEERLAVARRSLIEGLNVEVVARLTGLNPEEVQALRESMA
jgi:predicted transposase/invertase (TIGR01784 family)